MSRRNRFAGLFVNRFGMPSVSLIRRIQRGTITIAGGSLSNTAAINSVNLNHSRLNFLGCRIAGTEDAHRAFARVELTDATTVTALKQDSDVGADAVTASYEVIEYVPGLIRSMQRGTITAAAGTATATLTKAVNTAKTEVNYLGMLTSDTGALVTANLWLTHLDLTDSTTVTATAFAANAVIGYQVVEWY